MEGKGKIRWGILGPGVIAHNFAQSLETLADAEIAAVGSRSSERAASFAAKYGIPAHYGSYEELVADPNVDIVYVATPHTMHARHMILCLESGKAVLCEKPFTVNAREAGNVIALARAKNLFVMEGMWTRYLPAIVAVRAWLAEGKIGEIRMLKAEFGFDAGWNPEGRLLDPGLAGGALLDAGVYPVSFASMIFGSRPDIIKSVAEIGKTGVDEQFAALFGYGASKIAVITGAVRTPMQKDAVIMGRGGIIHIPGFLAAKSAKLSVTGEPDLVVEPGFSSTGKGYEASYAMDCLRAGKTESEILPLDETLAIMRTMDEIRAQWGLVYPCEDGSGRG